MSRLGAVAQNSGYGDISTGTRLRSRSLVCSQPVALRSIASGARSAPLPFLFASYDYDRHAGQGNGEQHRNSGPAASFRGAAQLGLPHHDEVLDVNERAYLVVDHIEPVRARRDGVPTRLAHGRWRLPFAAYASRYVGDAVPL